MNEPAFPNEGFNGWGEPFKGMTLRDYFAAKAMQGMLSNPKLHQHILKEGGAFGGWIESSAYGWADAMLKAREE
mgnify:CR=1 FL=1